jgi:hypothetical protein
MWKEGGLRGFFFTSIRDGRKKEKESGREDRNVPSNFCFLGLDLWRVRWLTYIGKDTTKAKRPGAVRQKQTAHYGQDLPHCP